MPSSFKTKLIEYAHSIGFDHLGVTNAAPPKDFNHYSSWVRKGYAANMWYLTEEMRMEKRFDLQKILPGAKSVVVGAISYNPGSQNYASSAKMARYAWGEDYHHVFKQKLCKLIAWMKKHSTRAFEAKEYVDTGPILERSLAQRAGLGWIGKNTCVMNQDLGSYILLGEIITTLDLETDQTATNHCGTCTACLDACPTDAFEGPYQLNASKCISYHTIESRDQNLPLHIKDNLHNWVAGCDICQEVCPWNQKAKTFSIPEFKALPHTRSTKEELMGMNQTQYETLFQKTSLRRIKFAQMKRNCQALSKENQS